MRRFLVACLLLYVVVVSRAAEPSKSPEKDTLAAMTLVEGRFGKALDARKSPVVIESDARFSQTPFTVECWARLDSRKNFNVVVGCDTKSSPVHWEIYSYATSGNFSAYLPGMTPSEIISNTDICDGKWHYLAMRYDGKTVELFVDARRIMEQAVKPNGRLKDDKIGPLTIGMAVDGNTHIGCDGVIDDVRISRGLRTIDAMPKEELPLDPQTVGLWHFDSLESSVVDPAWTPRPATGNAASYLKETDADWIDGRFRVMDTGPTLGATFDYPSWRGKVRSFKGTAIKVGEDGKAAVIFDRNQLRLGTGWTGDYLIHTDRRFGLLNTPKPAGVVQFASGGGAGWSDPNDKWDNPHPPTAPLPREWAKYRGVYLHGPHAILSYTVGKAEVLESPWTETGDGMTVFTRTVQMGPASMPARMYVCDLSGEGKAETVDGVSVIASKRDETWTAVAMVGDPDAKLQLADKHRVEVAFAARKEPSRVKVLIWRGTAKDLSPFAKLVKASPAPVDLTAWTKPGPSRWKPVVTRGEVSPDNAPYVIDTLTIPYENPYKALFFVTGVDFMPDGDIAICTAHGDVWLVSGADDKLEKLTWRRFATGLYQPMGLKVVDGLIHVIERGQLTRLHDTNHDGEADFYENVNNDWHAGGGEHSYDTCLETDPAGNFYFFKGGDTETPTGGCLLRVSKDGSKSEIFATGFRHPIGLGMSPSGLLSGADQQGNWMPATRIDEYRQGGFYGDMRAHHRAKPPTIYDPPMCWLPHEVDNSAGGQVWVPEGKFGPLSGMPLHLSYGKCKLFALLRQELDGDKRDPAVPIVQGGGVDLGLFFLGGICRGRFHPKDGNLYVVGLRGWQTASRRDGCLQRVRYTGKPVHIPVGLKVTTDGIEVRFSNKIDRKTAEEKGRFHLERWNYLWTAEYGSKRYSLKEPNKVGQDEVAIDSVTLRDDGKTVLLKVRDLKPVMQMQLDYTLKTAEGEPLVGSVWHTVHKTPGR